MNPGSTIDPNVLNDDAFKIIEESLNKNQPKSTPQPVSAPQNNVQNDEVISHYIEDRKRFFENMQASRPELVKQLHKNIETVTVPLPSKGLFYSQENPFHMKEFVEIRKIVSRDDDILRSQKLNNNGTMFIKLINALLVDKTLDASHLYNGDLYALIIAARIKSFGSDYDPGLTYTCNYCDNKFQNIFKLNGLSVLFPDMGKFKNKNNIFEITLPVSQAKVLLKLLTVGEEREIQSIVTSENKLKEKDDVMIDNTSTVLVRESIISINGDQNRGFINDYVEWLDAPDKEYILQFFDYVEPRLDIRQDIKCNVCKGTMQEIIPFTVRMFRPKFF